MNKAKRKRLAGIQDKIIELQGLLEEIIDEEQEALDNMPENLRTSQHCRVMDEATWALVDASNNLGFAADNIEEVITT